MNHPLPRIQQPATYNDVLNAPENMVAELVHGALHLQPRPAPRHAWAGSMLGVKLGGAFSLGDDDGPGGWWIMDEPELHLGDDVLVPDLAGWRKERMPDLPETAAIDLEPDWVCEILSPGTRQFDLAGKRPIYGKAGVARLWFVDPIARTLEAFENRDREWTLIAALRDDEAVSMPPFDAIEFPLSALWPD